MFENYACGVGYGTRRGYVVYHGDPMPAKLCSQCHLKLDEWCEFRKKCLDSEAHVRKRLQPYKDIKFVKEYFEKCAKFESSEIVSSSSKSNTGSVQNSDEVNSSVSAQTTSALSETQIIPVKKSRCTHLTNGQSMPPSSSDVEAAMKMAAEADNFIIVGDLNAHAGNDSVTWWGVAGRNDDPDYNPNREELLSSFCAHGIAIMNTFFQHRDVHTYKHHLALEYQEDYSSHEEIKNSTPEAGRNSSSKHCPPDYSPVNNYSEFKSRSSSLESSSEKTHIKRGDSSDRPVGRKEWVGNESELGTIVSVTGSASALWDTQNQSKQAEESDYYSISESFHKDYRSKPNQYEYASQEKVCPNCGNHFATEEEFEVHSCCLIGSSNNLEEYYGHFEDSISFESDYEASTYLEEQEPYEKSVKITPWKCLACKLYFQSSLDLRRHYSSVSCLGKKVKALNCEFCFRQFLCYNDLLQHQVVHINIRLDLTEDDLLCCSQCTLQFPDERRLKNHFLVHALKRKQPIKYTCSTCSKVFFQKDLYERHLTVHKRTEMEDKPEPMETSQSEGPSTTVPSDPPSQDEGKKSGGAIRCFRCGQMFASVKQLEHHEAVKHKNPTPYICRKCCLRFSARSQLLMHLRVHMSKSNAKTTPGGTEANEQTNCCTQCDAKFLLESDLESHMKTHKSPTSEPTSPTEKQITQMEDPDGKNDLFAKYKCSLCYRLYVRAASCIRHGQQSHKGQKVTPLRLKRSVFVGRRVSLPPGGKVKHKCPKCPKYFFSFNAFSIHTYKNHGLKMPNPSDDPSSLETEEPLEASTMPEEVESKCPFCSKDIKPSYISLHIKKFHRGEVLDPSLIESDALTDSCVCRYCLKQCSTPHNRKLHESIHYPARAQKNQCETCGQKFAESNDHEDHSRTCKSIRCGKCNKIFFKFTNLTQHSCSGTKNDEVHKCTVCLSAFTSLDLLQIHIKNFHGKKAETTTAQPGTSKTVAKKLERELWREESNKIICMVGEKFYCTFCDCEFSTMQESNDHRAAHPRGNWYAVQISDSLFQCTICDKFFETRKSSLLHINYHKRNLMPEQTKPFQMSLEPEVEIFMDGNKLSETPKSKKYNCRFCGAAFRDDEDLQEHLFHTHVNQT